MHHLVIWHHCTDTILPPPLPIRGYVGLGLVITGLNNLAIIISIQILSLRVVPGLHNPETPFSVAARIHHLAITITTHISSSTNTPSSYCHRYSDIIVVMIVLIFVVIDVRRWTARWPWLLPSPPDSLIRHFKIWCWHHFMQSCFTFLFEVGFNSVFSSFCICVHFTVMARLTTSSFTYVCMYKACV